MKKVIASIISVAMAWSVLSMTAIAAEDTDDTEQTIEAKDDDLELYAKRVEIPVGGYTFKVDEDTVAIDHPAYKNEEGIVMLPARAVALALGVDANNIAWDGESKTVTIFNAQRIITMTVGELVVTINETALPAAAKIEITNDRVYVPMKDLATVLGVTDMTWDEETKTVVLNSGNDE